jgi:hypothetical protein
VGRITFRSRPSFKLFDTVSKASEPALPGHTFPARPANHPNECAYCKSNMPVTRVVVNTSADGERWVADLEHTVRRLAAVAGEKGARPPDLTPRENRVVTLCMKVDPDDGYKR